MLLVFRRIHRRHRFFGRGAQANFPNGNEVTLKYDDLSLAESDLVKIVGREYVGLGLVADKCFCRVTMHT